MADIFVSYSRKDIAFARLIYQSLKESGLDTWIDWERIPVGEKWWNEIKDAIENSNVFLFIISNHSVGSTICKDEINITLSNNKRIIPIIIDDLPVNSINEYVPDLSKIQWIVFQRGNIFEIDGVLDEQSEFPEDQLVAKGKWPQFEDAIKKLNIAIHTDWEWVKYHTQLQAEARRWESNQKRADYLLRGESLDQAEKMMLTASQKKPYLSQLQADFVTESRKEEKRQQDEKLQLEKRSSRRLRWMIGVMIVGLVVAIFLGVNWLNQSNRAKSAEAEALTQRDIANEQANNSLARQLAVQALTFSQTRFDLASLLSIESLNVTPLNDAKSSLLDTIINNPLLKILRDHTNPVHSLVFSPDGRIMVSGGNDASIRIWDVSNPIHSYQIYSANFADANNVVSLAITPDGKTLISGIYSTNSSGEHVNNILIFDISNPKTIKLISNSVTSKIHCGESLSLRKDGKILAATCADGKIHFWDVSSPSSPQLLDQAFFGTSSVVFDPSGNLLASGENDQTIQLWDVSNFPSMKLLDKEEAAYVYGLAFSPDGKILASSSLVTEITLWKVSEDNKLQKIGTPILCSFLPDMAFSPDGKTLAISGQNNVIDLWDITDPSSPKNLGKSLQGHTGSVNILAFSKDGNTLASGSMDNSIMLWDMTAQKSQKNISVPFSGHTETVSSVAYRPDGKVLATGACDNTIRLWDTTDFMNLKLIGNPLIGHTDYVYSVTFSPDGKLLASAGMDKTIILWDVSDVNSPKRIGNPLTGHKERIYKIDFSPDGKLLASGSLDNTIRIWDVSDPENPRLIGKPIDAGTTWGVWTVAFSPDGKTLAATSGDSTITLWNITDPGSPVVIGTLFGSSDFTLQSLAFSPDGELLAAGDMNGSIQLWNISDLNNVVLLSQQMNVFSASISSLAFSPDGTTLAAGSDDQTIRLWDVSNPKRALDLGMTLTGHSGTVVSVAFSPDGETLASGSGDQTVRLWNLDLDDWESQACSIANRNMTYSEWKQYLPDKPYHISCPNLPVTDYSIKELINLSKDALAANDQSTAEYAYNTAIEKTSSSDNPIYAYEICWYGSIDGFAKIVLPDCEKGVSIASSKNDEKLPVYEASRGLARALTGNYAEAIEDFQEFINWTKQNETYDTFGKQFEDYVNSLKENVNPFTAETLKSLRAE